MASLKRWPMRPAKPDLNFSRGKIWQEITKEKIKNRDCWKRSFILAAFQKWSKGDDVSVFPLWWLWGMETVVLEPGWERRMKFPMPFKKQRTVQRKQWFLFLSRKELFHMKFWGAMVPEKFG